MGHSGSGKTTFAASFLYNGKRLGMDFEKLEKEGVFKCIEVHYLIAKSS